MNVKNPYEAFVDLSQLDQRLLSLQRSLDALLLQAEELKAEHNSQTRCLHEKQNALAEVQKILTGHELQLKLTLSSIMKKQKQIESSASSREYQSLFQEISELEKKKSELEEKILEQWQLIEELQVAYAALVIKTEQHTIRIAIDQQKKAAEIATIKNQVIDLTNEAVNLQKDLNPLILASYLKMKERVPNPGVEVIDGRCSGCYYPIPSQDLADLRKHKILACKDCYRLLYMR